MELSHKRARFELEKAASDSARDLEVRCHTSLTQGCTDSILRSDIGPDIDKIAGSGIGKINRSTGDPVFFSSVAAHPMSFVSVHMHVCRLLDELS